MVAYNGSTFSAFDKSAEEGARLKLLDDNRAMR